MIVKSPPLGAIGLIPDQGTNYQTQVGAWLEGLNLRFDDSHIKIIPEPELLLATVADDATWLQLYDDDLGPRAVYGTPTKLYRLSLDLTSWDDVTNVGGDYTSGDWHSFKWGESVVFNNGIDPPQILNPGTSNFIDLPNWGLLTSGQKAVQAKSLRPFNNTMVALNITIDGVEKRNMVWWSAPAVISNDDSQFTQPSWDYEDISTLSGFNYVGVDEGELVDSLTLDTSHMIYTRTSTYAMQLVGGSFVYAFRRVLEFGIAQLGAVADFNNFHFVVAPATIYMHDGSTIKQIANARLEDTFYNAISGFSDLRCTHDVGNKEIHTLLTLKFRDAQQYLIYNYEEDTWAVADAFSGDPEDQANWVKCQAYGLKVDPGGGTWDASTDTWDSITLTWAQADPAADLRVMYWLCGNKLMFAEQNLLTRDPFKRYYVRSGRYNFRELAPEFSTQSVPTVMRLLPHIEGSAETQFSFFLAENLGSSIAAGEVATFDPVTQYKSDVRVTSRYMELEVAVTGDGDWRLYSMDYDVEAEYAR